MKKTALLTIFLFLSLVMLTACSRLTADSLIAGSVVKIYTESDAFSYAAPWRLDSPDSATGSGCIIAGRRILTNAHVVADAMFIQVKRAGAKDKFQAEVEIIAHECDLAVLRVKDEAFFAGARPLDVGSLVALRDRVTVYGFPMGGEEMSMTEGIVSRVEVHSYAHSRARLLCGQIDAAINAGNSGGPVVKDGRIVGVAFQAGRGENISYMVPSPVVRHFLKDIEDGKYDGIPSLEISWQRMENPDLRAKFGLEAGRSGVLVNKVYPGSPADGLLQRGDVILSVGDRAVANDGTIEFRRDERTLFDQRVQEFFIGETVRLEVLRSGKVLAFPVKLTVQVNATRLVPHFQYDVQPAYFIVGGLVFQRLTANYIDLWGEEGPTPVMGVYYLYGEPSFGRRNIIVISSILADDVNVGYQDLSDAIIVKANGNDLSTLSDLVEAVEKNAQPFHVFTTEQGVEIVLSREKARERHSLILERYKVDSDRSPDLKAR